MFRRWIERFAQRSRRGDVTASALCFSGQRSKVKSQAVQVEALPRLLLITATCAFTNINNTLTIQSVPITVINKADLPDNLSVDHQRVGSSPRQAEVNTS